MLTSRQSEGGVVRAVMVKVVARLLSISQDRTDEEKRNASD
jgi:hypothetical protein